MRFTIALFFCIIILAGCATIFKGTSSTVGFSSEPTGATVYVNGFPRGTTPLSIKLESKKTYQIQFKKDGFESTTYVITNHVGGGWVILDVVLTGLIGVVVDAVTVSWYDLDQNAVNTVLQAQQGP